MIPLRRLPVAVLILSVAVSVSAQATPRIMRAFGTRYPEAKEKLGSTCMTCHTEKAPELNPYGADLKRLEIKFEAADSLDSDGDKAINIVEIKALTGPGDPKDKPKLKALPTDSSWTKRGPPDTTRKRRPAKPDTSSKGR